MRAFCVPCSFAGVANLSACDDTQVMRRWLMDEAEVVDVGAAGTAMRFLAAYFAVVPERHILTGSARMKARPIGILVEALRALGAEIAYLEKEGFAPLEILGGKMHGGRVELQGDVSSQFVSALLMIGPMLEGGLEIVLQGEISSRPYIEMTRQMMRIFGCAAQWEDSSRLVVPQGAYQSVPYRVEADWSAASYWYEMVALSSDAQAEVWLPGLCRSGLQGDERVSEIFQQLGVASTIYICADGREGIRLNKTAACVRHLNCNFSQQPDLAQTLVATCCALGVSFRFEGLQSLRIKETDRIVALCQEMAKLGFVLKEDGNDALLWDGQRGTRQDKAVLQTHDDHRMALSLAPLCLRLGPIDMANAQVVSKSYPDFWNHLSAMGFTLEKIQL